MSLLRVWALGFSAIVCLSNAISIKMDEGFLKTDATDQSSMERFHQIFADATDQSSMERFHQIFAEIGVQVEPEQAKDMMVLLETMLQKAEDEKQYLTYNKNSANKAYEEAFEILQQADEALFLAKEEEVSAKEATVVSTTNYKAVDEAVEAALEQLDEANQTLVDAKEKEEAAKAATVKATTNQFNATDGKQKAETHKEDAIEQFDHYIPILDGEINDLKAIIDVFGGLTSWHWAIAGRTAENSESKEPECREANAVSSFGHNDYGNKLGVQCCSQDGSTASRPDCKELSNWADAKAHCEENGLRLCTTVEALSDIGAHSGCDFDFYLVWTSDECVARHWTVVGSTVWVKPGAIDSKVPECRADAAVSSIGNNEYGNELGVQCCFHDGTTGSRPDCKNSSNWVEARAHCQENGLRLCTAAEIKSGLGEDTGCSFNAYMVWTSTECTVPQIVLEGSQTSQSSTSHTAPSQRAVDGNTASNWDDDSCTHTYDNQDPWWKVELGTEYAISYIEVTNRGDCCGERLNGFNIYIADVPCATNVQINQGETKTIVCEGTGSDVKIMVPKYGVLTLCEVAVFGIPAV